MSAQVISTRALMSAASAGVAHSRTRARGRGGLDRMMVEYCVALFLLVFVGSVFYYYINACYLEAKYPKNTFLLNPLYHFGDFTDFVKIVGGLNPYREGSRSIYPPFGSLTMYLWTSLPGAWGVAGMILSSLGLAGWLCLRLLAPAGRWLTAIVFLSICVCSYPVLFCLDRGNTELLSAGAIGLFLLYYDSGSGTKRLIASVALASAISLKIVPAIFLFLYFKDQRWRDLATTLSTIVILNFMALLAFKGSVVLNLAEFFSMIGTVQQISTTDLVFAGFGAGLYDGMRVLGLSLDWRELGFFIEDYYATVAVGLTTLVTLRLWLGRYVLWEIALALSAVACLVPKISNDYKLCSVVVSLLFMLADRGETMRWYRWLVATLFALASAPKNWIILLPGEVRGDIGLGTVLTPFFLLVGLLVVVGLPSSKRHTADEQGRRRHEALRAHAALYKVAALFVFLASWTASCWLIFRDYRPVLFRPSLVSPTVVHEGDAAPLVFERGRLDPDLSLLNAEIELNFAIGRPPGQLENLFGTGPRDHGMRLEYSSGPYEGGGKFKPGTLVLVQGRGRDGVLVHHLSHDVVEGRRYSLRISVKDGARLQVTLNGERKIWMQLPADVSLGFRGIRVGAKFDGSSRFHGDITLTSLEAECTNDRIGIRAGEQLALGLGLAISVVSTWLLIWLSRTK